MEPQFNLLFNLRFIESHACHLGTDPSLMTIPMTGNWSPYLTFSLSIKVTVWSTFQEAEFFLLSASCNHSYHHIQIYFPICILHFSISISNVHIRPPLLLTRTTATAYYFCPCPRHSVLQARMI